MPSLYEITENMRQLRDLFEADEIDEQTLQDTMESLNADMSTKVDGYGAFLADLKTEAAGYDHEIKRLQDQKAHCKAKAERLKANMLDSLQATGLPKVKGKLFAASLAKNPASVSIVDEKALPTEYLISQPSKPDKTAIKEALKNGTTIPGALLSQSEGVRFR